MASDTVKGFRVRAVRSGNWWAITVPDLPGVFSQSRRLDQVEPMAREAIALLLDVDTGQIGPIDIDIAPPALAAALIGKMNEALDTARQASEVAASARREAARALRADGLPMRDVGWLLGLSHQRVSQILAD